MHYNTLFVYLVLAMLTTACRPDTPDATTNTMTAPDRDSLAIAPLLPLTTRQLVIVVTPHPDSITAQMAWLSRKSDTQPWQVVRPPYPVSLGRAGLAPGRGEYSSTSLHPTEVTDKHEGDGKSPSGLFTFGTAFGYADASAARAAGITGLPYTPITAVTQCIEDGRSSHYNTILDNTTVDKDWEAGDFMRRDDDLYKWGVFVNHNTPAEADAGSCIFLHLWRGEGKPTAGCTAMTEDRMLDLLQWLDHEQAPRLLQVTAEVYEQIKDQLLPDTKLF